MNSEVKVLKSSDLKEQYSSLKLQTNRYKFNKEITEMISDFAKLHQYDGSKLYKEAQSLLAEIIKNKNISTNDNLIQALISQY